MLCGKPQLELHVGFKAEASDRIYLMWIDVDWVYYELSMKSAYCGAVS